MKKVSKIIILTNPEHVSEIYNEILPELLKKIKISLRFLDVKQKMLTKPYNFFAIIFQLKTQTVTYLIYQHQCLLFF